MAVRRDPKKSHRHEGAAKAACTKVCRPGGASDAEDAANDGETEVVDDDDDDEESDPLIGGVAGALIGGVAGLVIGGVLGAMAEAFKSAVDDDEDEDDDEDDEFESEEEEESDEEDEDGDGDDAEEGDEE